MTDREQMRQVEKFDFRLYGAKGDELVDGHALAIEAWGEERAKDKNSALLAMSYLWRRFGPPWLGGDDYKSLVDYTLTTNDPQVFLSLSLCGSGLAHSVGYLAHASLHRVANNPIVEWMRQYDKWWWGTHPEFESLEETEANQDAVSGIYWQERDNEEMFARAEQAIGAFPSRPDSRQWQTDTGIVHRINQALFDALKELERPVYVRDCAMNLFGRCPDADAPAERSRYAGYGVPKHAMDAWFPRILTPAR